jgi:hypothetical protein
LRVLTLNRSGQAARSRGLKEFKTHLESHRLTVADLTWLEREGIVFTKDHVKVERESAAARDPQYPDSKGEQDEDEQDEGEQDEGEQDDGEEDEDSEADEDSVDLNDPKTLSVGISRDPACHSM